MKSDHRPTNAFRATGGYVAVPAGLAARRCRRPLVLHDGVTVSPHPV